jgi:hypothetical protein
MRYTDKEGNTLTPDVCMTTDSFFMEADVYTSEPLEMHFDQKGELKAGKKPLKAAHRNSDSNELLPIGV